LSAAIFANRVGSGWIRRAVATPREISQTPPRFANIGGRVTMTGMDDRYSEVLDRDATLDDLKEAASGFWGKLKAFMGKVPFARDAVALYYFIIDPKADFGLRGTAALAILYFISPLDFVPDVIPIAGMADDAMVIATAISVLAKALTPYRDKAEDWLERGGKPEPEVVKEIEVVQR
jgi:uncharacterized membrane protein YkvA (DUF1232 family)